VNLRDGFPDDAPAIAVWLVSVRPDIGFTRQALKATELEDAKAEALSFVRRYVSGLAQELEVGNAT